MKTSALCIHAALLAGSWLISAARADVRLPALFGDHMVLQQGSVLPVWGWAEPGEQVTVAAEGQHVSVTTGSDGRWRVALQPLAVTGKPIELTVSGTNTITLEDVLVGEVWICSGQSNMEWPLHATFSAPEIPQANHPLIRLFKVAHRVAFEPQDDCVGKWVVCTPESAAAFSGVGYFFGKELQRVLNVPVGMIGAHWGGTPAQAWTSLQALRRHPPLKDYVVYFEKLRDDRARIEEEYSRESLRAPPKYECRTRRADNPTVLNNGMIAPLIPYTIRGVIWYQGESNCNLPIVYRTLFPALISDWRQQWGQGDFPFLFVQLANGRRETKGVHLLREAQLRTLSVPKTGMAVTIDIGEPDIHPRNKKDVGLRLARAARHVAYGEKLVFSGPLFKAVTIEGATARLTFDHIGGGLTIGSAPPSRPSEAPTRPAAELKGFTVAGADRTFLPARARIDGDTVVVWCDEVTQPVAVRYGWTDAPDVNLYNTELLPASPFRTDDWE